MALLDWVGQTAALTRLQMALAGRRLHHAFVFHGPEGVGKAAIAQDLARTLLCETPRWRPAADLAATVVGQASDTARRALALWGDRPLRDLCGQCATCRQTAAGAHPDVTIIVRDPARAVIPVAVMSEQFLEKAHVKSHSGRAKVFVIPEADRIAEAGYNKMLKTLEEPPPGMVTILVCRGVEAILPTILSRSQVIGFAALPAAWTAEFLTRRHGLAAPAARYLAGFCNGSPGEALRRAAEGLVDHKRGVLAALIELTPASVFAQADALIESARAETPRDAAKSPSEDIPDGDPTALPAGEALRTRLRTDLAILASAYRDVLVRDVLITTGPGLNSSGVNTELVNADQADVIDTLTRRLGGAGRAAAAACRAIERLAVADAQITANVLPGLAIESLFDDLACLA